MDDCIARGGISHVLAQARASLKHPSRPFTPKTGTRPLFHGDDYRPSSRPSSTYSRDGNMEFEKPMGSPRKPPLKSRVAMGNQQDAETLVLDDGLTTSPRGADDDDDSKVDDDDEDDKVDQDDPSCFATPESIRASLLQLHAALDDYRGGGEDATGLDRIKKLTSQVFHDVHLLREHDPLRIDSAYSGCLDALLACVHERAPSGHVIALACAAIQLWACRLAPQEAATTPMTHACKLLFLESKEAAHDDLFCSAAVVETLLTVLERDETQLWSMQMRIYVTGTLKNVSASPRMVQLLATNGAIKLLARALASKGEDTATAQMLVQVTAILRNLSVHRQCLKQFWAADAVQALCDLLPRFPTHAELVLNVSRVLSKLTLHEAGRHALNHSSENLVTLVQLVSQHAHPALVVRAAFVVGNLTATNDRNRKAVLPHLSSLVRTLRHFYALYIDGDDAAADVLVKLVRLLANAAIHPAVGAAVGATALGIDCLLDLLAHHDRRRRRTSDATDATSSTTSDEELMLNVVSCVTNISYHATTMDTKHGITTAARRRLARLLATILTDPNDEAVVEAARALGNLSRFPDVFDDPTLLLPPLVALLDHSSRDVVLGVCGVLMNAALDGRTRNVLRATPVGADATVDVRDVLVELLRAAGLKDAALSAMLCKVLYNFVSNDATAVHGFASARRLADTLDELLDAAGDADAASDFVAVARALHRLVCTTS
ncbi:Aste57867_20896 [Aphanomyces stellatus]|uniref:Aste57867_20896 protein n=1 Tax=Aphanomyces stellatus TaxID=120398 RepID=A0A485LG94_9STRA|nr:hypothetical protein As57867_020828 [Aphanomyces stellatus]VFT97573.1 Aste57867_20896 [Aphanomyces stellatus]